MASITHNALLKNCRNNKIVSKLFGKYTSNPVSVITATHHRNFSDFKFSFEDDMDSFGNNTSFGGGGGFGSGGFGGGGGRSGGGGGGRDMFGNRQQQSSGGFGDTFGTQQKKRWNQASIEWSKETLTPFTKDFYKEHPNITKQSQTETDEFRKSNSMIIHGQNIPKPFDSFEHSGLPDICIKHLNALDISSPSAIQQQGIPMALSGRDVIGISRTGSGKTLAYLLPLIVHINAQAIVQRGEGPIGLILAPTRELSIQIDNEISRYVSTNPDVHLKHCAVYGGSDRHRQIYSLRQSPDILVATPGRLLDLLECGETNFKRTTYTVLDEADRMLDMGFRDDLECILSYIRPDKQTLMWSATWPKEIQQIANEYMNNAIRVQIGSTELHANQNIEQCFRLINFDYDKVDKFQTDIEEIISKNKKCLVFTNTKRNADLLQNKCISQNIKAQSIHGDKTQHMREKILNGFRSNQLNVLIATDVVARGIDITDIDVVLCYDFPSNVEDYVHRIGRTGRANKNGLALSYITNTDISRNGKKLETVLKRSKQKIPQFLQNKSDFF